MFHYLHKKLLQLGVADSSTRIYFLQNASLKSVSRISNSTDQSSLAVSYLRNSCGLSEEAALKVAKKVKFDSATAENADSVLTIFKNHGLTKTHIANVITKSPLVLTSKPEQTLKPKLEFFHSLGVSGDDLCKILITNPRILRRSLESQIIPSYEYLKSILQTDENVVIALRNSRIFTHINVRKVMEPNIEILLNNGVPKSRISKCIMSNPGPLGLKSDRFNVVIEMVKQLGFDPNGSAFLLAALAISSMSKSKWESKVEIYKGFGWSEEELLSAFKKLPWCMVTSEKKIRKVMEFFIKGLGLKPSLLAQYPRLLVLSLEKRILPRASILQILMSKDIIGRDVNLAYAMAMPDERFREKYVTENQEIIQALSVHQGKMAVVGLDIGLEELDVVHKL